MNSVQFHIPDWTVATRHLNRIERSIYLDLLFLYYDSERPLPADDFDRLARRVLAHSDEERVALQCVLDEYFTREGDLYRHDRCDEEIERFHTMVAKKSAAGKASARSRRKMSKPGTDDEQVFNGCATPEQQPDTRYPIPDTHNPTEDSSAPDGASSSPKGEDPPARSDRIPYQAVVDLYHTLLPELPAVKVMTNKRKAALRQRHIGLMQKDLESWRAYFEAVKGIDFLMGRVQGKDYRTDFDGLLTEKIVTGVIEGRYLNTASPGPPSSGPPTPAERVASNRHAAGASTRTTTLQDDLRDTSWAH